MEAKEGTGDSLDHAQCQKMANLVEELTTTGKPTLDQDKMKELKKICKTSNAYVEHCFHLIITQLEEDHAEIRLSAFQVINELFVRSHRFRELLVADMQEYLELTVETNIDVPLPPPKPAAKLLKEQALRAIQEWHSKFGKAYKKLGLGYTYLRNCKKVDFVNIQARSDAERQREEERQRRVQLAQAQKLSRVTEEMNEIMPEIRECLTQCENCFQLLLPNITWNDDTDAASTMTDTRESGRTLNSSTTKNAEFEENDTAVNEEENSSTSPTLQTRISRECQNEERTKAFDGELNNEVSRQDLIASPNEQKSIFDLDAEVEPSDVMSASGDLRCEQSGEIGKCSEEVLKDERHGGHSLKRETVSMTTKNLHLEGDGCDHSGGKDDGEDDDDDDNDEDMEDIEDSGKRDLLQHHGLPSWTSININISVDADEVRIEENEDNTDVLTSLADQQQLLTTQYLVKMNDWIETLTKMGQSDKLKCLIDLKREISANQNKYRELSVHWTLPQNKGGKGQNKERTRTDSVQNRCKEDGADSDEDDDDGGFDEVPEKEGYEADIPEELKEEFGMISSQEAGTSADWHPVRNGDFDLFDPASRAGSIAAMKEKLRKIREETKLPPGTHVIPPKSKEVLTEEECKRQELLRKAPVISFGTDLAYWLNPEDIKAPVILRPDTDARTWISSVDDEEVVLESAKDSLKTRVMSFTGSFQPVKWKCRALLPNGSLCERMDRHKCPFHGVIVPRDEFGNRQDVGRGDQQTNEPHVRDHGAPWKDEGLLRDIKGATGLDLGSSSSSGSKGGKCKGSGKKGKGKAKKYPGLTDIRRVNNTSRNRLEKVVMNRGAVKRVAAAMSRLDQRRYMDKFGNNFNYAFKN